MGPTGPIADGRTAIEEIHGSIEKAMVAMGVKVGSEDWWKLCNFRLCNIAYEWAKGTPFTEIMKTCDKIQEGTIVRAILRLDELLRKMKPVLCQMGEKEQAKNIEIASEKIKRDIVFAASLYLQQ
eukprot:GHVP01011524.1.p1 GENE.GHVP01011524.1~~GHVP01011524.1.p1  ORF type:complete len:125 (+),score=28.96 GHVP01011524.1:198-572(+)